MSLPDSALNLESVSVVPMGQADTRLYRETVPGFVAAELERLYAHPLATATYQAALDNAGLLHTYVGSDAGDITAVLQFRVEGRRAVVINEFTRLNETELRRFADRVFAGFPEVGSISLRAVHTDALLNGRLCQRYPDRADIVADLPDSADKYIASLHRSTRSTVKARINRLRRTHPDVSWKLYRGADIPEHAVRTLVRLNQERMRAVRKVSYNDERMAEHYLRIVRECDAMLLAITIDGRICAGALNVCAGAGCFGLVNAFDAAYARHSLGMVAAFLSICEAIELGVRRFHFGWDPYEYKSHLLGVPQPSWRFEIYRSRLHLLGACGHAMRSAVEERVRRLKAWMLAPGRRESVMTRVAVEILNGMRSIARRMRA